MPDIYEAIVRTRDGTYHAYQVSPSTVCVTEDGIDGIVDQLQLPPSFQAITGPEELVPILIAWTYEMRRGETIISAKLRRRDDR
jgi:hypothetical protein